MMKCIVCQTILTNLPREGVSKCVFRSASPLPNPLPKGEGAVTFCHRRHPESQYLTVFLIVMPILFPLQFTDKLLPRPLGEGWGEGYGH